MTLYNFYALKTEEQRKAVQEKGVYLMSRNEGGIKILLFALDGFYVEVYYDNTIKTILPIRSFRTTELLYPYLNQIDISTLLQN